MTQLEASIRNVILYHNACVHVYGVTQIDGMFEYYLTL